MTVNLQNKLASFSHILANSNSAFSTAAIELPTDLGRSYAGYKRGGILEGGEKLRKEIMTAAVWIGGIPGFQFLTSKFCEKILKIPMNIAYSNSKKGNDAIGNCAKYLISNGTEISGEFKDVSGLQKYIKDGKFIFADKYGADVDKLIKNIKNSKHFVAIVSVLLNCAFLGFILPKFNQKLTEKKIKKMAQENKNSNSTTLKTDTFEEFKNRTNKNNNNKNISFKGFDIPTFVDCTENSTRFRLMITDIPMILGRMLTSRNKYEALEYLLIDGSGMYLYNYCRDHVKKLFMHPLKAIDVDAKVATETIKTGQDKLISALNNLTQNSKLTEILPKDSACEIYKRGTYEAYGKTNSYVKNSQIKKIDESVISLLKKIKETIAQKDANGIVTSLDMNKVSEFVKRNNNKVLLSQCAGLAVSIFGLAILAPNITYWITKKITGRNEFTGIANYDDNSKKA